jgi:DHA1 family inner membrane transport protein
VGIPAGEPWRSPQPGDRRTRRLSFIAVTSGYMAVTAAESLLAPLFPLLRREEGFSLRSAGFLFALLAASIAIGNLVGGLALSRRGAKQGALFGLALTAAGTALAAASSGKAPFIASQAVLGFGSGTFFASGLSASARLSSSRRRGLAIGFFGVAFSAGLALAALLAAFGQAWGWRTAFVVSAALALATAVAVSLAKIPAPGPRPIESIRPGLRRALGLPLVVGGVAAGSQYGTISFIPAFAVSAWSLSPASAALMLGVARVLSVPAKLVSGNAADQRGAVRIARRLGIFLATLGAWWTLVPGPKASIWAAVVFAAFVSGLGPVANLLAFEGFGERGALLGIFRSAQIAVGAVTSAAIGGLAALFGLRTALAVAAVLPVVLVLVGHRTGRPAPPERAEPRGDEEGPGRTPHE